MRCFVAASSIFIATFLVLTPPGLCPCWLMGEPGKYHPHLGGDPERAHQHDYLFDLFQSHTVSALPPVLVPAGVLMECQSIAGLWRRLADHPSPALSWISRPLTPPPRR